MATIKPIRFGTYAPYKLPRQASDVTRDSLGALWAEAPQLVAAIGVYIIASKHGKQLLPWYVGKTDKGFKKRFDEHLRGKHVFQHLASLVPEDDLFVVFLARHTNGGKLKKARKANALTKTKAVSTIVKLEYNVLREAHRKNSALINKSNRVFIEKLVVPGLSNPQSSDTDVAAKTLRNLLQS